MHLLILRTLEEYLGKNKNAPIIGVNLYWQNLDGGFFFDPIHGALLSPILSFFQEQPSGLAIALPD